MADDFVGLDVYGIERVNRFLERMPDAVADDAVEAGADFMLNVLRANPPQRYVSRAAAYGQTFQSDKQRRWFFANIGSTFKVPYERTQRQSRGWKKIGQGKNVLLVNETPGIIYTRGEPEQQSRLNRMVGWKSVSEEVEAHRERLEKAVYGAAKQAIRRLEAK